MSPRNDRPLDPKALAAFRAALDSDPLARRNLPPAIGLSRFVADRAASGAPIMQRHARAIERYFGAGEQS
jgi:hypothetical protein